MLLFDWFLGLGLGYDDEHDEGISGGDNLLLIVVVDEDDDARSTRPMPPGVTGVTNAKRTTTRGGCSGSRCLCVVGRVHTVGAWDLQW